MNGVKERGVPCDLEIKKGLSGKETVKLIPEG